MNWVKCTDALPKIGENNSVLICLTNEYLHDRPKMPKVCEAYLSSYVTHDIKYMWVRYGVGCIGDWDKTNDCYPEPWEIASHWMSMPEPPCNF